MAPEVLVKTKKASKWFARIVLAVVLLSPVSSRADDAAPTEPTIEKAEKKPSFEVYGFAQVDYIQDFKRVAPDWNATLRPTRIPTIPGLYGSDGEAILSARQSRLGAKGALPVGEYDLVTKIEFDFFGRGTGQPDSGGQNTIRLRQAYGSWGPILGGLTASLFMDDDFWPTIIDYWGPCGMVFFRNVQIRYTPFSGTHYLAIALERPGADIPNYAGLPDLIGDSAVPDFTAQYRFTEGFGYIQLAGILRSLGYDTKNLPGAIQKTGKAIGWGLHASSTIKIMPQLKLLLAVVGGQGIENYMNDATPDIAGSGTSLTTATGAAVPMWGATAYLDFAWSEVLTTALGYSTTRISNTNLQDTAAFKTGQYASGNLLVHPFKNFFFGPEFLWGQRVDKGGAVGNDYRLQISLHFDFSSTELMKSSS
jgi:hypothetical protein